jgi:hypothetical protein
MNKAFLIDAFGFEFILQCLRFSGRAQAWISEATMNQLEYNHQDLRRVALHIQIKDTLEVVEFLQLNSNTVDREVSIQSFLIFC